MSVLRSRQGAAVPRLARRGAGGARHLRPGELLSTHDTSFMAIDSEFANHRIDPEGGHEVRVFSADSHPARPVPGRPAAVEARPQHGDAAGAFAKILSVTQVGCFIRR